ncbi:MAG: hypothetical protein ACYTFZ_08860 [Planctomycetota bacterium]|jgi:hypothetical protein
MQKKTSLIVISLAACVVVVLAVVFFTTRSRPPAEVEKPVEKPAPVPEPDPDAAALKLIADEEADYKKRLAAVESLGSSLRAKTVYDALQVIKTHGINESLRNDLLRTLQAQKHPVDALGPAVIEMWEDTKHTSTWRNFCLQHMADTWLVVPKHRGELEAKLLEVTGKDDGPMGATALVSLSRIGEHDKRIGERAMELARAGAAAGKEKPEKALTGLHILTKAGDPQALKCARKAAADKTTPVRLRMAALATLGAQGTAEDEKILVELSAKRSRLGTAAKLNLKTLRSRLKQ